MKKFAWLSPLGLVLLAVSTQATAAPASPVEPAKEPASSLGSPSAKDLTAARLEPGTCSSSKETIYQRAAPMIEEMRAAVDAEYQEYLARQPDCWEQYRENEEYWRRVMKGDNSAFGGVGAGQGFGSGHGTLGGSHATRAAMSMSGTNVQVEGVDEADLVKTDGRYVYLSLNGALRIVEALKPRVLSVTQLPGKVQDMFVAGDRAVVYSSFKGNKYRACTYGYDCKFAGDGSSTQITVLDITDRKAPRTARVIGLTGSLITSRRIFNTIHTVVSDGDAEKPPYEVWMRNFPECGVRDSAVRAQVVRLKQRNEVSIRAYVAAWAPTIQDNNRERKLCDNIWQSKIVKGDVFTTLVSFDLKRDTSPAVSVTLRSSPGAVYASADSLFVSVTHEKPGYERNRYQPFGKLVREFSQIHKFQIGASPENTRYVGSGVVPGRVLNQFSMDDWGGYLRVATSYGRLPDPKVKNAVSVLEQDAVGNLVRVGAVEPIAPGEDIRAVRFDGDRGYVVTFKKTDPLFVLDLQQPTQPRLLGELKIPGFSTYLHRIDPDHLLSIGFDANDHGSFAYYDGLLLQLFDVHTPTDPKLLFREKIGTRGSGSEAATDHLAFNYLGERGLLAIPATICEGGSDGKNGNSIAFSGLLVYNLDTKHGFKKLGGIEHALDGANCTTWWSKSSSVVKRSVFLDNLVYSIALDRVKVQNLKHLGTDVADLDMKK